LAADTDKHRFFTDVSLAQLGALAKQQKKNVVGHVRRKDAKQSVIARVCVYDEYTLRATKEC
jgi:hypothetical protein